ncbi:hypothetical protein Anapl_06422 [Anas platyrhynchos]|uniref:Uncharacterized protein n=1 Tax=Anas platyrhynchos TaxID=8839 RepID=R0K9B5_ANAPL|nr:hypothetical protein Anapl_06422 [Anas platyrhynchos]
MRNKSEGDLERMLSATEEGKAIEVERMSAGKNTSHATQYTAQTQVFPSAISGAVGPSACCIAGAAQVFFHKTEPRRRFWLQKVGTQPSIYSQKCLSGKCHPGWPRAGQCVPWEGLSWALLAPEYHWHHLYAPSKDKGKDRTLCVTQVLPSNSLKENCTRTGPRKHAEAQRSVPAGLGTPLTEGLGQQTRGGIVRSDQDSGSNILSKRDQWVASRLVSNMVQVWGSTWKRGQGKEAWCCSPGAVPLSAGELLSPMPVDSRALQLAGLTLFCDRHGPAVYLGQIGQFAGVSYAPAPVFAKTAQKSLIVVGFLMIEAFPFGSSNQLPNSISIPTENRAFTEGTNIFQWLALFQSIAALPGVCREKCRQHICSRLSVAILCCIPPSARPRLGLVTGTLNRLSTCSWDILSPSLGEDSKSRIVSLGAACFARVGLRLWHPSVHVLRCGGDCALCRTSVDGAWLVQAVWPDVSHLSLGSGAAWVLLLGWTPVGLLPAGGDCC